MSCSCAEWAEGINAINAPIVLQFIRNGTQFQGIPFRFCPWCGSKLAEEIKSGS